MLQATVHEDLTVRAAAFDILGCAVACNAQPLREFLIAKDTGNAFFLALVAQLQGDPDTGIKIHITGMWGGVASVFLISLSGGLFQAAAVLFSVEATCARADTD